MPFNSSLCLSARAKTSSITLPRNAERGHYLEPDLRREAFSHCAMLILGSCSCAKSNWRSSPWFLVCRDFLSPGSKWQRSRSSLVGPFGVSDKAAIKLCTGLQALKLELKLKTPLLSSPPRLFAGGCHLSLWGPLCGLLTIWLSLEPLILGRGRKKEMSPWLLRSHLKSHHPICLILSVFSL